MFSSRFFCLPLLLLIDPSYSHKKTKEMETQNDGRMYLLLNIWPCLASKKNPRPYKGYLFVQFLGWKTHGWFYVSDHGRTYPKRKVWAMTSRTKKEIKGVSGMVKTLWMVKWPPIFWDQVGSFRSYYLEEFPSWMFSYIGRTRRQAFFVGVLMEDGKRQMMTFYLEE